MKIFGENLVPIGMLQPFQGKNIIKFKVTFLASCLHFQILVNSYDIKSGLCKDTGLIGRWITVFTNAGYPHNSLTMNQTTSIYPLFTDKIFSFQFDLYSNDDLRLFVACQCHKYIDICISGNLLRTLTEDQKVLEQAWISAKEYRLVYD